MDLITQLAGKYTAQLGDDEATVGDFVEFARIYLTEKNKAVNTVYMPKGLGLRLQDGTVVSLEVQDDVDNGMLPNTSIPITRDIGFGPSMIHSAKVPITGK